MKILVIGASRGVGLQLVQQALEGGHTITAMVRRPGNSIEDERLKVVRGHFFTGQLALGKTPYALFVAWCYGAPRAIDRISGNVAQAEVGSPRLEWELLGPYITESWVGFFTDACRWWRQ